MIMGPPHKGCAKKGGPKRKHMSIGVPSNITNGYDAYLLGGPVGYLPDLMLGLLQENPYIPNTFKKASCHIGHSC